MRKSFGKFSPPIIRCFALAGLLILSNHLAAQAEAVRPASTKPPVLDLDRIIYWNFSGAWEKDFARSDNWLDELKRIVERQRAEAERKQRREAELRRRQTSPFSLSSLNQTRSGNIVALARLAEYISRQSTMRIVQTKEAVRIEREGDAPLICGIGNATAQSFSSPYGEEYCGWDRNNLVFRLVLPGDLQIMHTFDLAPDYQSLRMVTRISNKSSEPFSLIQTFNRYEAPQEDINCVQTVSRGKVCSFAKPEQAR